MNSLGVSNNLAKPSSYDGRKKIKALERRRDYLIKRFESLDALSTTYDRAECSALSWILDLVKEQEMALEEWRRA